MRHKSERRGAKPERNRAKRSEKVNNSEESYQNQSKPLTPLTKNQKKYLNSFTNNIITFGIGEAGTGKSYCAAGYAANQLKEGKIDSIIITRPAVEAGESFGFLPGELSEKYLPYLEPFKSILNERLGVSYVEYLIKVGKILPSPLSFMRGKTFNDCVVILDEAQNTSPTQMKMFLTRIGKNCTVIIDGDPIQKDIRGISGLEDAVDRLQNLDSVGIVRFTINDIVRSGIIKDILLAYR